MTSLNDHRATLNDLSNVTRIDNFQSNIKCASAFLKSFLIEGMEELIFLSRRDLEG